jgi:hypothetical protein
MGDSLSRRLACLETRIAAALGADPPLTAEEEAEQAARAARHEPYLVYVGGHRLLVVYENPPDLRQEWPR